MFIALDLQDHVKDLGNAVAGGARDVESCTSAARKTRPNLALMDLRFANGLSGNNAFRWLGEVLGVRCLFTSGNLEEEARAVLSITEPLAFIGKPISPHQSKRELSKYGHLVGRTD